MKRRLPLVLPLLVLLLSGLAAPRPTVGQAQPILVEPQELYRFRISNSDLGYSLSALYAESIRDGFYYEATIGSIYRAPAGYTPDPASGLVPLHRWIVVEDGWRVYTYHSIYYTAHGSNYTYSGILGYVFPPTQTSHNFEGGPVGVPLTQMSMWYSQKYGVFNGRGAPGFGFSEFPPHSSFAYHGVIAAMPPAIFKTKDCPQGPTPCMVFPSIFGGLGVGFYPPPIPPDNDGDGFNSSEDCNDSDSWTYPGAPIYCEPGFDRNCSGTDDWDECYPQDPCGGYPYCTY